MRLGEMAQDLAGHAASRAIPLSGVKRDGEHAAADVAADGGGVDEPTGGDGGADADVGGEVDVGHDGDVGDVVGPPHPLDRLGSRVLHRHRQPSPDGGGGCVPRLVSRHDGPLSQVRPRRRGAGRRRTTMSGRACGDLPGDGCAQAWRSAGALSRDISLREVGYEDATWHIVSEGERHWRGRGGGSMGSI